MSRARSSIALVCLSTCGVTRLACSDLHRWVAVPTCLSSSQAIAFGVSGPPRRLGNNGSWGRSSRSASQVRSTATVSLVSVAHRSLRPLPSTRQWAPASRLTSPTRRLASSDTRSPVWIAVKQQRVLVAAPEPGGAVRGAQQRLDLLLIEVGDRGALVALGGDLDHAGDRRHVLGVAEGGVAVERVDRRQPRVAGRDDVAALVLEVVEERADQRRVQVGELQAVGLLAGLLLREAQQQLDRVAICGDRAWAGVSLGDQPLGEVRLDGRGDQAHGVSPRRRRGGGRRVGAAPAPLPNTSGCRRGGHGRGMSRAMAACGPLPRRSDASPAASGQQKRVEGRAGAVAHGGRGLLGRLRGSASGTCRGRRRARAVGPCGRRRTPRVLGRGKQRSRQRVYSRSASVVVGCSGTSRCLLCLAARTCNAPSSRSTSRRSRPSASPSLSPVVAISPISVSNVAARSGGFNALAACINATISSSE